MGFFVNCRSIPGASRGPKNKLSHYIVCSVCRDVRHLNSALKLQIIDVLLIVRESRNIFEQLSKRSGPTSAFFLALTPSCSL